MLVLERKLGQQVIIANRIVVTVLEVQRHRVKLGFVAPAEVPIQRDEIEGRRLQPACIAAS